MEKVIIIKYGELSTKSDNINFFLKTLKNNIAKKLNGLNFDIKYDYGRMIVYTDNFDKVMEQIKDVFGIHEIAIGYLFKEKALDSIKQNTLNLIKDLSFKSFRVTTKRSDKKYPGTSPEISKEIGSFMEKFQLIY